jgi:DnaK suppressor protein
MVRILDLRAIRRKLGRERTTLLERIQEHKERLRAGTGINQDPVDLAQAHVSRQRSLILLAQARQQLEQVDAALQRLDEGTYGKCTKCGERIDTPRLNALPYALLCIKCQERQEQIVGVHL